MYYSPVLWLLHSNRGDSPLTLRCQDVFEVFVCEEVQTVRRHIYERDGEHVRRSIHSALLIQRSHQ